MANLETMKNIMDQKSKDIETQEQLPLDKEGKLLAEGKRFTFDVINTPVDPLR